MTNNYTATFLPEGPRCIAALLFCPAAETLAGAWWILGSHVFLIIGRLNICSRAGRQETATMEVGPARLGVCARWTSGSVNHLSLSDELRETEIYYLELTINPGVYPSPQKMVACPACKKRYLLGGYDSSLAGATVWSDGFIEGPEWPDLPGPVVRCEDCHTYFIAGANIEKDVMPPSAPFRAMPALSALTLVDVQVILGDRIILEELSRQQARSLLLPRNKDILPTGESDPEMEALEISRLSRALAVCALYKLNHLRRRKKKLSHEQIVQFEKFASQALSEPDEYDEWKILQNVEWYRNLGQFRLARRALRRVHHPEFKKARRKLRIAIWLRRKDLFIVSHDRDYYRKPWWKKLKKLFKKKGSYA